MAQIRAFPLLLRLLDRLRTQRPDPAVISEGERLSGVREEGLRVRDVAPALLRVPDLGARFVEQGLEDPFAALVERPRRDAPQESLGRDEVAPRGERLRLFDVPLERERLDARLPRFLEDRVGTREHIDDARLALRDLERAARGAGEVQSLPEVARGLRLLR